MHGLTPAHVYNHLSSRTFHHHSPALLPFHAPVCPGECFLASCDLDRCSLDPRAKAPLDQPSRAAPGLCHIGQLISSPCPLQFPVSPPASMIPEPPPCWAPQTTNLVFLKTLHGKYDYEPILQRKKVRHRSEDSPPGRAAKNWQSRDPNAGSLSPEPGPFTTKRPCPTPRMRSKPSPSSL